MHWLKNEIHFLLSQVHDPRVLKRLNLLKGQDQNDDGSTRFSSMQTDHTQAFFAILTATAAERVWYCFHFTYTGPEFLAGILSSDGAESAESFARVRQAAAIISEAEAAVNNPEHEDRVVSSMQ